MKGHNSFPLFLFLQPFLVFGDLNLNTMSKLFFVIEEKIIQYYHDFPVMIKCNKGTNGSSCFVVVVWEDTSGPLWKDDHWCSSWLNVTWEKDVNRSQSILQVKYNFHFTTYHLSFCPSREQHNWSETVPQYVILNVAGYPNSNHDLQIVLSKYSRMRNYYNMNPFLYAPFHMVEKTFAEFTNATYVGDVATAKRMNISINDYPDLCPVVQSLHLSDEYPAVYSLWKKYRYSSNGKFYIVPFGEPLYNFAYCATPTWHLVKPWNIGELWNQVNREVWIVLCATIFILPLMELLRARAMAITLLPFEKLRLFQAFFLSVISVPPPTLIARKRKSLLLFIWMLFCVVLTNYYTGTNTGVIIAPPTEESLTNLEEAAEKNFSVVLEDDWYFLILNASITTYQTLYHGLQKTVNLKKGLHNHSFSNILSILFPKTAVNRDREMFISELAFGENTITLSRWPHVIAAVNEATTLIAKRGLKKMRHCYLGKKLFPFTDKFYGFTPPGSKHLYQAAHRVIQSGIWAYWTTELWDMMSAPRVQDRAKMISPTQVAFETHVTVDRLQIQGKVLMIFFLWSTGLFICTACFVLEKLKNRSTNGPNNRTAKLYSIPLITTGLGMTLFQKGLK